MWALNRGVRRCRKQVRRPGYREPNSPRLSSRRRKGVDVTKHSVAAIAAQLADREAIRHCVLRYCRGLDRLDEAMLRDVYWPDATDDHIAYSGPAEGFIEVAREMLSAIPRTQHLLGNILIEMRDDTSADCESYFQAYHLIEG